jgi:hypothetical protein
LLLGRFYVILYIVKKLVKLVLFYSVSFAILMIISTGLRFLAVRAGWAGIMSGRPESVLGGLIVAARWSLSLGIYGGIVLGLSYTARNRVFAPIAVLFIGALSLSLAYVVSVGLENWENVPPAESQTPPLGGPGLIVANNAVLGGTVVVLLQGPSNPGPRVVAVSGRPLNFQAEFPGRDVTAVPSGPFGDGGNSWFLQSIAIDLRMSGENLWRLFKEGTYPFMVYTGALIVLLTSCLFIFRLTAWPLANVFLGCLAFRGILALEILFNTRDMQEVFGSYLQNWLPVSLSLPLIFCAIGVLAYVYSFLVFVTRRRDVHED